MLPADKFVKILWPVFASVAAGVFSVVSWHSSQTQQRYESLNKAIENATSADGSSVRRIAGIWQMNQFWDDERFEPMVAATPRKSNQPHPVQCRPPEETGQP
jgi:hypothetical protein